MFEDRMEAGRLLAASLAEYQDDPNSIILALPRGGATVGFALHQALGLPLNVFITRKLGAPQNPEYALGALTETGHRFLNIDLESEDGSRVRHYLDEEVGRQQEEIRRRQQLYRRGAPLGRLDGRTVILVDDGIATGATAIAAVRGLRTLSPGKIVVTAPVASQQALEALRTEADAIVVLSIPSHFFAVGEQYRRFPQVEDREVLEYLDASHMGTRRTGPVASGSTE